MDLLRWQWGNCVTSHASSKHYVNAWKADRLILWIMIGINKSYRPACVDLRNVLTRHVRSHYFLIVNGIKNFVVAVPSDTQNVAWHDLWMVPQRDFKSPPLMQWHPWSLVGTRPIRSGFKIRQLFEAISYNGSKLRTLFWRRGGSCWNCSSIHRSAASARTSVNAAAASDDVKLPTFAISAVTCCPCSCYCTQLWDGRRTGCSEGILRRCHGCLCLFH